MVTLNNDCRTLDKNSTARRTCGSLRTLARCAPDHTHPRTENEELEERSGPLTYVQKKERALPFSITKLTDNCATELFITGFHRSNWQ